MKVAVVVNCLKIGGMERVACNLSDAFAKQGHNTHLIYLKNRKIEVSPSNPNVKIHLFALQKMVMLSGIGFIWLIISKLLNIIFRKSFVMFFAYAEAMAFSYKLKKLEKEAGRFDLIIFRGQGTFSHIWPLKDPRFVFVCESMLDQSVYGSKSKQMFSWLFSNRHVVCISKEAQRSFMDLIHNFAISCQSISIISNPNNYEEIRKKSSALEANIDYHTSPYILGLGRLVGGKNFPLLIDAYHYARNNFGVTHDLVIVGEGREKAAIENKIKKLGLEDCIFLKGKQSNPFPWYQHADLFVLSSKSEGLGMVLIEALACGTPVVATNCPGGVSDIMRGQLSDYLAEQSPESLAEKIVLALKQGDSVLLGPDVAQSLAQFDEKHIVQQYCDTYLPAQ
ncbi:glycosyltransferase [Marinomonas sp. BSi20584]|uniref:glycosyltransferase n=1 Tax=Marinomonas sp. BSi20584 TaxID=1594462 RepID=UPI000C1DE067|nr:glycosyltransferase [Marinomonas sp. BSi20584]PJE53270.1 glycosyl transferase [Marinomonas sp. BSi20584]